jgi:hypothetical protein
MAKSYGPQDRLPYFQFYPDAFLSDPVYRGISCKNAGILLQLLCIQWQMCGKIPMSLQKISKAIAVDFRSLKSFMEAVPKLVEVEPGCWGIPYLYEQYQLVMENNKEHGTPEGRKKGGKQRAEAAPRGPDGTFLPGAKLQPSPGQIKNKDKEIDKDRDAGVHAVSLKKQTVQTFWGRLVEKGIGLAPGKINGTVFEDNYGDEVYRKNLKMALKFIGEKEWPCNGFTPSLTWVVKPESAAKYAEFYLADHPEKAPLIDTAPMSTEAEYQNYLKWVAEQTNA